MKARIISEVTIEDNPERHDPTKPFFIQKEIFFIEVKKWYGWKKYGVIKDMTFSIQPINFNSYREAEKHIFELMFKDHCKINKNKNEYKQEKYGGRF